MLWITLYLAIGMFNWHHSLTSSLTTACLPAWRGHLMISGGRLTPCHEWRERILGIRESLNFFQHEAKKTMYLCVLTINAGTELSRYVSVTMSPVQAITFWQGRSKLTSLAKAVVNDVMNRVRCGWTHRPHSAGGFCGPFAARRGRIRISEISPISRSCHYGDSQVFWGINGETVVLV